MERNNVYNTKQKEKIFNIIKDTHEEFTPKDLYMKLNKEIGLTTIYRYLDRLVNDDLIIKNVHSDNSIYYQYIEKCSHENHFFLKCKTCGTMIHIDCDCIDDLSKHIKNEHKFKLDKEHIIIDGYCNKCIREGN
jgi:Fur family ferric uptake transcriptional regulator